jgi:hypothetical protein
MHAGDAAARDALFAAGYEELRRLARSRLRDGGRNTVLETTSLVHECYSRFVTAGELRAEDHRAFDLFLRMPESLANHRARNRS